MAKVLSVPDVGEMWSPVMISLRDVHPSSHTRVSPMSNDERLCMFVAGAYQRAALC